MFRKKTEGGADQGVRNIPDPLPLTLVTQCCSRFTLLNSATLHQQVNIAMELFVHSEHRYSLLAEYLFQEIGDSSSRVCANLAFFFT